MNKKIILMKYNHSNSLYKIQIKNNMIDTISTLFLIQETDKYTN